MNKVKNFFRDISLLMYGEIKAIIKDKGVMVFLFIVPFAYPLIYTAIYNPELSHDIPIVVVDKDNSVFSREYIRRVDQTQEVRVIANVADVNEAKKMMQNHDSYGYIILEKGFEASIYDTENSAKVHLISDLSSIFYYKAYMVALNDIALSMSREYNKSIKFTSSPELTDATIRPIDSEFISMYNYYGGYASFLIPAVLILILQQAFLLGISMLSGTAREEGRHEYLDPISSYKKRLPLRLSFARTLSYFIIFIGASIWSLIIVPYIYDSPMNFDILTLLAFLLPYSLSVIFFAQTISLFIRGREEPIILLVFSSVIFIFLTGVSWPWSSLPAFWKVIANLVPSSAGARAFVAISSMGASISEIKMEYINLWSLTLLYMLLSNIGQRFIIQWLRGSTK